MALLCCRRGPLRTDSHTSRRLGFQRSAPPANQKWKGSTCPGGQTAAIFHPRTAGVHLEGGNSASHPRYNKSHTTHAVLFKKARNRAPALEIFRIKELRG